jgi:hypothetical protein
MFLCGHHNNLAMECPCKNLLNKCGTDENQTVHECTMEDPLIFTVCMITIRIPRWQPLFSLYGILLHVIGLL